ncbi:MAG: hypothetical protein JJU11_09155 [Candidatus Sumerlaeia bacterium]|nr:hypothetical protein [Candidatus Sumerlaeia bacterium]
MDKPIDRPDTWIAAIRGLGNNPVMSLSMNRERKIAYPFALGLGGLAYLYMTSVNFETGDILTATWLSIIGICSITFFCFWRGEFAARNVEACLLTRLTPKEIIVGLAFWPIVMSFLSGALISMVSILAMTYGSGLLVDWTMGPIDLGQWMLYSTLALVSIVLVISGILQAFMAFHWNIIWKSFWAMLFTFGYPVFFMFVFAAAAEMVYHVGLPDQFTFPHQLFHSFILLLFLVPFLLKPFHLADKRYASLLHEEVMTDHSAFSAEKWWKPKYRLGKRIPRSTFTRPAFLRLLDISALSFVPLIALSLVSFLAGHALLDYWAYDIVPDEDWYTIEHVQVPIPNSTIAAISVFGGPLNWLLPVIISASIVIALRLFPRARKPIQLPDHRALSTVILLAIVTLPVSLAVLFHGLNVLVERTVFPSYLWGDFSFIHFVALGCFAVYHLLVVIGLTGWLLSFRRPLPVSLVLLAIPALLHAIFLQGVTINNLDLAYSFSLYIHYSCIFLAALLILISLPYGPDRFHRKLLRDKSENGTTFFVYTNTTDPKEHHS